MVAVRAPRERCARPLLIEQLENTSWMTLCLACPILMSPHALIEQRMNND